MNSAAILAAAFPVLLIVGALLGPLLARRDHSRRTPHAPRSRHAEAEYSHFSDRCAPIGMTGSSLAAKGAHDEPLAKGDQYFADWAALQARFNEEPA